MKLLYLRACVKVGVLDDFCIVTIKVVSDIVWGYSLYSGYKDTLAVLDKLLAGFYVSNKVNFKNYFANKLIKWYVFEAVQNTRSSVLSGLKHSAIASCFKSDKVLLLVF